jgi:glutamate-1-semialdehyde 2,1-aminomutase
MSEHRPTRDQELKARARRVIPGGMWGHLDVKRQPPGYPQYFERARGCRMWDVDGREYIDFMCSWGPIILGHHDAEVDAAVRAQAEAGDCLNGPSARLVELAELVVELVPHADWAMFSKNGTDATTVCVTIARAATKRRKVLAARRAYHGAAPWCTPSLIGVTAEDRAHIVHFDYNDPESLRQAAAEAKDDLAAILVSAFRHDLGRDHELPTRDFAAAARDICDRTGAALIVDDVRAGFRLHMGGSWELVGVRPDLAAWSKAIANGHALAAVTGSDRFREAASSVFTTGSFWCASVPMAAAIATLTKLRDIDGVAHMHAMGQRLRDGLATQAKTHGIGLRQSGPPQMPLVLFEDDADLAKGTLFCQEALRRGVFLHQNHTMFLSVAHTAADIDQALEATDAALKTVVERFGAA